jgi:outer membrane PBP1 activator LpoA protein
MASLTKDYSVKIDAGLILPRARDSQLRDTARTPRGKGGHHNARRGFGLLLIVALAGCGANAPAPERTASAKTPSVQQLLDTAHSTALDQRAPYLRDAAALALKQNDLPQAERILRELDELKLNAVQRAQSTILHAHLQLKQKQPARTLATLQDRQLQQDLGQLPARDQIEISLLRAKALEDTRNYFGSVQELVFVDPLLDDQERKQNHRRIWSALQDMAPAELERQLAGARDPQLRGWLELAALARRGGGRELNELAAWQQRWPAHPAARDLPPELARLRGPDTAPTAAAPAPQQPRQIALLLPLSGKLAAFGMAVRDGFMAGWYDARKRGTTPPPVRIYDSAGSADAVQLYRQALGDGAGLVIGPLEKQQVAQLYQQALPVPTLALNRFESNNPPAANLYQFSLAAEDETTQIADIAADENRRSALIIAPDEDIDSRELQAFEQRWRERGGSVGAIARYRDQQNMSQEIRAALNIPRSEARAKEIESILNRNIEYTPRRRQDIDMVFILAKPAQARVIKPLLDFYYAGDLAVYSTSRVYNGYPVPRLDRDLDKVRFTEMPFVVETGELKQQILAAQPHARNYLRLYAMGLDSFSLYPQLLQGGMGNAVSGQTGVLTFDAQRVVHRQSVLAVLRNGALSAATAPDTSTPPVPLDNTAAPAPAPAVNPPAAGEEEPEPGDE